MKFEDKLEILQQDRCLPGQVKTFCSITDHPIIELVEQLGYQGIDIDPSNSEARVQYDMAGDTRKATVPLRTQFDNGDHVGVNSYVLRNTGLEITLENYRDIRSTTPPDFVGGDVDSTTGIIAYLTYHGSDEGQQIIKMAKETIENLYNPWKKIFEGDASETKGGKKKTDRKRKKKLKN